MRRATLKLHEKFLTLWTQPDSNRRALHCKWSVLPTELWALSRYFRRLPSRETCHFSSFGASRLSEITKWKVHRNTDEYWFYQLRLLSQVQTDLITNSCVLLGSWSGEVLCRATPICYQTLDVFCICAHFIRVSGRNKGYEICCYFTSLSMASADSSSLR